MMVQHNKLVALIWIWWCTNNIVDVYGAVGNPQTHLLVKGCSPFNASNLRSFFANIDELFSSLKTQISNENKHFAVEDKARGEVLTYAMFQCRNYLSNSDCLACFDTATTQIRNCSTANGARFIYDGCFLRYESESFYDQTNEPGGGVSCGKTSSTITGFRVAGQQALMELQTATPQIKDFYAATKTQVVGGGPIYAVAQCVETATATKCLDCMQLGYTKLKSCLPNTQGRAYDAGCFIRYSTTPFFADSQIIDITPFLDQGGTNKKRAIIGGLVGGVVALFLVLFAWRWSRKSKGVSREIISGKKSTDVTGDEDDREYLLQRAWKLYERDSHLELLEEAIDPNEYDAEEVKKIIEIALMCTQALAATRPTMSEVVILLKSKSLVEHLRLPTMPVVVGTDLMTREGNSTSSSNATASISIASAR
ncbi:hypothetical protein VNO78_28062 [Psophocarpus tetragonolobus]|uniref:Gnk2-homologous domain-containing protein n=1 Tax=Psophocarpus tetragonolobus TaxID=3891 RepID=A0AAN9S1R5_PSOTE